MDFSKVNSFGGQKHPVPKTPTDKPLQRGKTRRAAHSKSAKPVDRKLKTACEDFEATLIQYMVKSMKKTIPGKGFFGNSFQQGMYESYYFQEVATKMARDGGIGIGDAMYRQLRNDVPK